MGPFNIPEAVLDGFKERAESLAVQGDRVCHSRPLWCAYQNTVNQATSSTSGPLLGICMCTPLVKRQVSAEHRCHTPHSCPRDYRASCRARRDQEGGMSEEYRPDCVHQGRELPCYPLWCVPYVSPALVELTESAPAETQLTLFPSPTFSPPTPLVKTKGALCFALHTGVEYVSPESGGTPSSPGAAAKGKGVGVPAVVTRLAVGCRRKIVLYSWRDGEPQDVQVRVFARTSRAACPPLAPCRRS